MEDVQNFSRVDGMKISACFKQKERTKQEQATRTKQEMQEARTKERSEKKSHI